MYMGGWGVRGQVDRKDMHQMTTCVGTVIFTPRAYLNEWARARCHLNIMLDVYILVKRFMYVHGKVGCGRTSA